MSRGNSETMSTDWVPSAGFGVVSTFLAWIVSWRVSNSKLEGKLQAEGENAEAVRIAGVKRADEIRAADSKRADELRAADAQRADELRKEFQSLKDAWFSGIERVQELSDNMARLQSSQNVLNEMSSKRLESLTDKVERHGEMLADHTSSIRLLIDKVMSK